MANYKAETFKKNENLDDLRNNIIEISSKFPDDLCAKIIGETDEKIRLCRKENGKILNKS